VKKLRSVHKLPKKKRDIGLTNTQTDSLRVEVSEGHVRVKDDLRDYADRGEAYETLCFLDFMLDTYEGGKEDSGSRHGRGRHRNARVHYRAGSGRDSNFRITRTLGHERMPDFVGVWFPRKDDTDTYPLYCASMLALLVPWRHLADLRTPDGSFVTPFEAFLTVAGARAKAMMENIQYYHECLDGVQQRREQDGQRIVQEISTGGHDEVTKMESDQ
jgi:hypothetical protein